jgi:hypothetical protein
MGIRIPIQSGISDAFKITGVGESAVGKIIRSKNAKLFPSSSTKVRSGETVNDLIGLNAATPNRYASPPFRMPQGTPPWKAPAKNLDPRTGVKARAKQEEAIAKAQVKRKKQKETSAAIAKRRAINKNK